MVNDTGNTVRDGESKQPTTPNVGSDPAPEATILEERIIAPPKATTPPAPAAPHPNQAEPTAEKPALQSPPGSAPKSFQAPPTSSLEPVILSKPQEKSIPATPASSVTALAPADITEQKIPPPIPARTIQRTSVPEQDAQVKKDIAKILEDIKLPERRSPQEVTPEV